jgi:hypothetical protein
MGGVFAIWNRQACLFHHAPLPAPPPHTHTHPHVFPPPTPTPPPFPSQMLSERLIPFVALDVSASRVQEGKKLDLPVYFGDAGSPAVLHAVGAERAACAVRVGWGVGGDTWTVLPGRSPGSCAVCLMLATRPLQQVPVAISPPPPPAALSGHHAGHSGRQLPQRVGHAQTLPPRQDLCARV